LLTALGAKPEQVRQVLENAARNAAHPPTGTGASAGPPALPTPAAPKSGKKKDDDLEAYAKATNVFGTDEERAKAQLPPPPEEDSQLSVLLRPGLLTDVEIFVEKIPEAISVPNQAVLEKDGQQFVYVLQNGKFEKRSVKIARRSESVTVIKENLKANEIVAMGDPFADKTKGGKSGSKKGGNGMAMPSGGGGGK